MHLPTMRSQRGWSVVFTEEGKVRTRIRTSAATARVAVRRWATLKSVLSRLSIRSGGGADSFEGSAPATGPQQQAAAGAGALGRWRRRTVQLGKSPRLSQFREDQGGSRVGGKGRVP